MSNDSSYGSAVIDKDKASLYGSVFSTREGTLVVEDLLSFVGYYGDPFVAGDPCITAYNCGQRRVVARILNLLGKGHAIDMIKSRHERLDIDG